MEGLTQGKYFLIGFVGDKIGYNLLLIIQLIILGATNTYVLYIPPYREITNDPTAFLYRADGR